nr:heavy metal translocating P-type ATPase [uncultured Aminipila sp.]
MNKIYNIENIDCANCAAKIERLISNLPEVQEATITFATKQLRVTADNPDKLLSEMERLANTVENGVVITERVKGNLKRTTANLPRDRFDCGHEHQDCECGEHHECHEHHGHHECGCVDDHQHEVEKKGVFRKLTDLHFIGIGAILFMAGVTLDQIQVSQEWWIGCFTLAYIVLGGEILLKAIKNIGKGQIFDENFLMSIATIGAFAIQEYPEAVGVMLFFRIGEFFEEKAVERSRSQIMEAVDLRPEVVSLIRGNNIIEISPAEAQIDDILLVKPGDRIPLDGIVVEGESRVDTSPITGEPVPVKVGLEAQVISGCINASGVLKIKVEKTLENSMVTRILDSVENAAASKPHIDKFITRFARVYTPFVVVLATLTAIIPSLITGDWQHWIYTALTFLVISCPCALVLSVPLAFFSGIGSGSKKGILFKGGVALEALKSIKAVVMDKTGTLTKGEFVVQNVICSGNLIAYMTSGVTAGNPEKETDEDNSRVLEGIQNRPMGVSKKDIEEYLLAMAASCELSSTHPIGVSIVNEAKKYGLALEQPKAIEEIAGKGIKATCNAGMVLCGNQKLLLDAGVDITGYQNPTLGSEVLLALNNQFIGSLTIADTIKKDSFAAIAKLKKQSIATAMLTGDGEESANAVAKATGIDKVFSKLLPDDKLRILQELRKEYGQVMFIGDGINDAPVLAGADVGAAMGSGADAAIEAADIVFMTSSVEAVPQAIAIAKITNKIAMQNVVFALLVKALVMVLGLAGLASMWMAVFADSGVAMLCVMNSVRILYKK